MQFVQIWKFLMNILDVKQKIGLNVGVRFADMNGIPHQHHFGMEVVAQNVDEEERNTGD